MNYACGDSSLTAIRPALGQLEGRSRGKVADADEDALRPYLQKGGDSTRESSLSVRPFGWRLMDLCCQALQRRVSRKGHIS